MPKHLDVLMKHKIEQFKQTQAKSRKINQNQITPKLRKSGAELNMQNQARRRRRRRRSRRRRRRSRRRRRRVAAVVVAVVAVETAVDFAATSLVEGTPAKARAQDLRRGPAVKSCFLNGTWTSIAVLFNPRMGRHSDIQNMPKHTNHALALGNDTGRRVWIQADNGQPAGELWGTTLNMHDKPVTFDARSDHMVEPQEGSMWALAASGAETSRLLLGERRRVSQHGQRNGPNCGIATPPADIDSELAETLSASPAQP